MTLSLASVPQGLGLRVARADASGSLSTRHITLARANENTLWLRHHDGVTLPSGGAAPLPGVQRRRLGRSRGTMRFIKSFLSTHYRPSSSMGPSPDPSRCL